MARLGYRCMVGGMALQNPPPHIDDDTALDAPRISRRTAEVLGSLVGLAFVCLTLFVLAPWFAGLLNIHRVIVEMAILVSTGLVLACPPIIRRVRARSAPGR